MPLPRLHLFETEELPWLPSFVRRGIINALGLILRTVDAYAYAFDSFVRWSNGGAEILDLGSGSGDHVAEILRFRRRSGNDTTAPLTVCLSDLAPDVERFRRLQAQFPAQIRYVTQRLDATRVGVALGRDLRSMFTAFHHLRPHQARALLLDAAQYSNGVFIFEPQTRRVSSLLANVMGLVFGVVAPFVVRPFDWRIALFSTVLPIIPLLLVFDGVVSVLRSYTVAEVEAMIASLPDNDFDWEVREIGARGLLASVRTLCVTGRRRQCSAVPQTLKTVAH